MDLEYLDGPKLFVVRSFFSDEECAHHIAVSEKAGYRDAPITTAGGFVMRKGIRNNERVMIDDPALAAALGERARSFLPREWFGWELVGLNERFRYYRYDPGQYFARHTDGYFERVNGERSHFTFMVYLNDGFEGGATAFFPSRETRYVQPERGMALVFYHRQVHEGQTVVRGRKYVLRSDVLYRKLSE